MTSTLDHDALLWPAYARPTDLAHIETVPLPDRRLPGSTYAALRRAATLWPGKLATTVIHDARHFADASSRTFGELFARTNQVGNALIAAGVTRRAAVGLLSPNVSDLTVAVLAAQAVGIAAPANPALSEEHLYDLFSRAGVRVLIAAGPEVDSAVWAAARVLAAKLGVQALYALRPTMPAATAPDLEALDSVDVRYLADAADSEPADQLGAAEPEPTDLAALFHTGGTTGTPKLAAHTHANEVSDAWMLAANSALDQDSVLFAALPLFHVNALIVTLLSPLLRGQHVVWAGPLGYRDQAIFGVFWKLVEHYRVATMSGVPTVYSVLSSLPVDADITSLRFAIVGASPLPAAVEAAFTAHTGVPLLQGYGLSEATCASARNFPGFPKPGSVGQRLPYQHVKVVDIDESTGAWTDLPPGRSGVLAVRGPTVFAGYVVGNSPDGPVLDSLGKVRDGWLDTGDLARVDEDGFVYLTGRAKDLIIRGGHNIDPAMIEDALLAHPDVTGANAVGRPDVHAGEVPVAYVTVRAGASVTADELAAFAAREVPEQAAAPKEVVVLDALPVTAVGKPYKVALRIDATERVAQGALADAGLEATVRCALADGQVLAKVTTSHDRAAVGAVLDRFAFAWTIT
jgi:fatty-acyl-CoA synthase